MKRQSHANEVTGELAKSNVVKAKVLETCNIGAMAGVMMTLANVCKVGRTLKVKDGLKVPHMVYEQIKWVTKVRGDTPPVH